MQHSDAECMGTFVLVKGLRKDKLLTVCIFYVSVLTLYLCLTA
jgi:hypothetical protein